MDTGGFDTGYANPAPSERPNATKQPRPRGERRGRLATVIALAALIALSGCAAARVSGTGTAASASAPSGSVPPTAAPVHQYDLSIGDSYPAGYQPAPSRTTRVGFPYQVVTDALSKGYDYRLVNLACGGATTASVLHTLGCESDVLGPGAPDYASLTQADAAVQFLQQHRGQVGLITISIGGNDFLGCLSETDLTSCIESAIRTIGVNLATLLTRLRSATGPDTRIVGTTYPNLFLGNLLHAGSAAQTLANLSVVAFKSLLNPQLEQFYAAAGAKFVDVTKATGGYDPLTNMTTLAPYGRIPVPVAEVCTLTWYCRFHDPHPTPAGHALIARLIVATLPQR